MTTRSKFIVAGALLFVTGFAISFLLFSFTTTAQATTPAQAQDEVVAAAPAQAAAQPAQNELDAPDLQASPSPTSTQPAKGPQLRGPGRPGPGGAGGAPFFGGPGFNADGPEIQGVISNVNGSKLTVGSRTVNTNDQTVVGDSNGTLKVTDLKQGDRVTVLGKAESDKSLTARWILRLPALPKAEQGTVSGVNAAGNSFTFKTKDNTEWTATVTANTAFTRNGQTAKLSDFQNGDQVVVLGTADATAHKIEAQRVVSGRPAGGTPPTKGNFTRGTVKSVDTTGNSLVVTEGQTDVKVTVDSSTRYVGQNIKSLGDVKTGQVVFVTGTKQSDGSIKATAITVGPAGRNGRTGDTNFYSDLGAASIDPSFNLSQGASLDPQFETAS